MTVIILVVKSILLKTTEQELTRTIIILGVKSIFVKDNRTMTVIILVKSILLKTTEQGQS